MTSEQRPEPNKCGCVEMQVASDFICFFLGVGVGQ